MNGIIKTMPEKCAGCNKCIFACKVHANSASIEQYGHPVVGIADKRCIDCGACLKSCDHEARSFFDDTERFFSDLASGTPISLLVAPAVRYNFRQYKQLFGFKIGLCGMKIYSLLFFGFGYFLFDIRFHSAQMLHFCS